MQAGGRKGLESRIHLAYGRSLLQQQRYEEGMVHLGMSELCTPVEVLSYFSFLAPQTLLVEAGGSVAESDAAEVADKERVVAVLMPYLLSFRSRLLDGELGATATRMTTAVLLDTAILNALLLLPDGGALLRFVHRANYVALETGVPALEKEGRYAELVALLQVTVALHACALSADGDASHAQP